MTIKYKHFLLIFSLLIEAESDEISNGEDAEDRIPDTFIIMAARILQLLHNNIDSLKRPDIIKSALKKLKSFIVKDKKDGTNEIDSKNSIKPEMSSSEGSSSS